MQARVITVADAYDAMTRERSYKSKLSKADAILELKRCSGVQFDPDIVNSLIGLISKNSDI